MKQNRSFHSIAYGIFALFALPVQPLQAAGDLLVAPTRIVLSGSAGSEVVLSNKGQETATYRISLIARRMTSDGKIEPATSNTPEEEAALSMISFAPHKITLAPNQPQTVRLGVRVPAEAGEGEYRAHMVFRAVPDTAPASENAANAEGVSISITPIYGIAIPVIVRVGNPMASASISDARIVREEEQESVRLTLHRSGKRSIYGALAVLKPGQAKPVAIIRGIAVYPEIESRTVSIPIPDEARRAIRGPATIRFSEEGDGSNKISAEAQVIL